MSSAVPAVKLSDDKLVHLLHSNFVTVGRSKINQSRTLQDVERKSALLEFPPAAHSQV